MTAPTSGAVGILHLCGPDTLRLLCELTGREDWPPGRLCLVNLGGLDRGLAVYGGEHPQAWAQLQPHGNPMLMQQLLAQLLDHGAVLADGQNQPEDSLSNLAWYPEASSGIEADMLHALSLCPSSGAVDLLLDQPRRWREWWLIHEQSGWGDVARNQVLEVQARSNVLERYRSVPGVVVAGQPNVGKSTLMNKMLGRSASLVADLPGTTRDWVAGWVELEGVALRWMDTPGLRHTDDPVEARAIELAEQAVAEAELIVLLRDHEHDWPDEAWLEKGVSDSKPVMQVWNKVDLMDDFTLPAGVLGISAQQGTGLETLAQKMVEALGLPARPDELWAFAPELGRLLHSRDWQGLKNYLGF